MPPIYFPSLSTEKKREFLNSIDTIVTDCDGVLWKPEGLIKGAPEAINALVECGKQIFFVTNNSTKTREQFHDKFAKYGFNVVIERLYNTSTLAAQYVRENLSAPSGKIAYVVGTPALSAELDRCGVRNFGVGKDEMDVNFLDDIHSAKLELRENVGAVVVGFDPYINYVKMLKAVTYLKNEDCLFVCTNTDEVFPSEKRIILPGTGSIVAGIRVASGREPFVVGKPSSYIAEALKRNNQIDPKRTLFVGDRCNTDILMGNLCSFTTLLVLSGVHTIADVRQYEASSKLEDQKSVPHYYADSINDLCI